MSGFAPGRELMFPQPQGRRDNSEGGELTGSIRLNTSAGYPWSPSTLPAHSLDPQNVCAMSE